MAQQSVVLTCQCNENLPVSFGDAGGQITCACGKLIEIPRLSELRRLAHVQPQKEKFEELSSRQIYGRYFLGFLFCLILLGQLYQLLAGSSWDSSESAIFRIGQALGIIIYATLAWFTVLGRIWARLILIVFLLFGILAFSIALIDTYSTALVLTLSINVFLAICLMGIKT